MTLDSAIIVALIGLYGVYLQIKNNKEIKSHEELTKKIDEDIKKLQADTKTMVEEVQLSFLKRFLVMELSKIRNGDYEPTSEQIQAIYESKEKYNKLGGDSYVDDMFDELKKSKLL